MGNKHGYTRSHALMTQHALSEDEIEALVARCPEENRWAFGAWLKGERHLDGDPIESTIDEHA